GRVMDANRAAENYLGRTLEQMRGHTLLEMPWQASREDGSELPLEDYPQSIVVKTGEPVLGTVIRIHDPASNSRRWLKVDAGPVSTLEDTGAFEVWVTLEEIRKNTQKRADEDDRSFSTIIALKEFMDWAPDAMIVSNPEGHILLANSQIEAIFGFTQDELLRLGVEDLVPHSVRNRHQGHRATYLQESQVQSIKVSREVSAIRKDGSEFPIEIHFSTHTLDGETVVLSTIHDITIRRQAEENLRDNQQLLQESQEIARIQSWTADFKSGIIVVKQRPNPEFGMPPGTYRLTDMLTIIHPDDRDFVQSMWATAADNIPLDMEYRILLKNEIRWVHVKTKVTPDENNLPGPTLGFTQDVTERRLAEELTHTQRDLARMISTAITEEEAWPQCLAAALRISGMDSGGIYLINEVKQSLELVYHQGLGERFIQSVSRYSMDQPNVQMVLAGVKFFFSEAEVAQQEDQREEGLRSLAVIPIIDHGHVLGCINLASHSLRDTPTSARQAIEMIASEVGHIIVHMRTEASLHENEEKYRSLINSQDSAISTIDSDGIFHYINQIGAAPFGGDPQLIIGKKISDLFPAHIAAWQMEQVRKVLASQQGLVEEYKSIVAGQVRWRRVSIQPIHDAAGQVHLAMVNSLDITDRKNAEEALLKNEALLGEAQRIGHIGHWEWVAPGGEIYCSDEVLNILGLPPNKNIIPQKDFRTMILTEDLARLQEWDQKAFASRSDLDYEFRIQLNDGSIRWVKQLARITYGEAGQPVRMLGTLQDITERKSVENALIANEKKLRSMINSQTHFLLRIDMEGKYTYWNPKFEQEFGWFHKNGLLDANALDTILPYHHQRVLEVVQNCLAQPGRVFSVELDKPARDGGIRTTLWEFTCITDEYNRPVEIQCMGVEITERKKAEAAQHESEENYRLLFETMVQGVVFQDANGQIIHANPAAQEILGLTLGQMQGRTSSDPRWRTIREDNSEFSGEAHPAMRALKTGEPVHNVVMGVFNPN
ncbi:MAG TPA: PAS domain S-box protein, partial [Anaerolineales bacterium]|nr:PAS domain S-box protein [Anaerolineales bacterium]